MHKVQPNFGPGKRRIALLSGLLLLASCVVVLLGIASPTAASSSLRPSASTHEALSDTLTVDIGAEPSSLDSLLKSDGQRDTWSFSVQEGLTARKGKTIVPLLATSWKAKGKTWLFTLRQGVTFHDGSPLTSADVVASYNRMLNPKNGSELLGNFVTDDTKVQAVGTYGVAISRPVADPTIPARASLVMIVPASWATADLHKMDNTMIGTGPYQFVTWDKGQQITLKAYSGYWGPKPSIQNVVVKFNPEDSVRLAALKTGETQMAINMSPDLASQAPKVIASPVSEILQIRLNTKHGPFKDIRVRKAANLAIDRKILITQLYKGYAKPAKGQEVGQYVFGANPALSDYAYDPAQAKKLLQQARAVGTTVTMSASTGHWPNDREVAQAMAGMLDKVGFKVKLELPVFKTWVEQVFVASKDPTKAPDMQPYNHSNQLFDSSLTLGENLLCAGSASLVCNKRVDALAKKALTELNTKKRAALYYQAWKILRNDADYVAIADVYHVSFLAKNLQWTPPVDGFLRFQDMRFSS